MSWLALEANNQAQGLMAQLDGMQATLPAPATTASSPPQMTFQMPAVGAQKAWPSADGWRQIRTGQIAGETWGSTQYALFEVCSASQVHQEPFLFIWLHGQDGTATLQTNHMVNMQMKLRRRCFFLLPTSPKVAPDGNRFTWGVRCTKAESKNDLGFVYGEMHAPYLLGFCKVVQEISEEVNAVANIISGYSMGGFGSWQLAAFAPGIFTAVLPVAGYGIGTLESGGMYNAPQPHSSHVFNLFANEYAPKLAKVPVLIAIHAVNDSNSSFKDTQELINLICGEGGDPTLVTLDGAAANSDAKKSKTGHGYFTHAVLSPASEGFLYSKLRVALDDAIAKGLGPVRKLADLQGTNCATPGVDVQPDGQDAAPKAPMKISLPSFTLEPSKTGAATRSRDHVGAALAAHESASNAPMKLSLSSWTLEPPKSNDVRPLPGLSGAAQPGKKESSSSSSNSSSSSSSPSEAQQKKEKKEKEALQEKKRKLCPTLE